MSVDGGALSTGQISHVDNLENLSLTGREAALWNAALQRHLAAFETRLAHDRATEFAAACGQVERIAWHRLRDLLA